jgi:hypothetical protein
MLFRWGSCTQSAQLTCQQDAKALAINRISYQSSIQAPERKHAAAATAANPAAAPAAAYALLPHACSVGLPPAEMRSRLLSCCLLAALIAAAAADQGKGNDDGARPRGSVCVTNVQLTCKLNWERRQLKNGEIRCIPCRKGFYTANGELLAV